MSFATEQKPLAERTATLLAAREARVLTWALLARLIFLAGITLLTGLQTLEQIPPGVIAQGPAVAAPTLAITLVTVAAVTMLYRLARLGRHVDKVGLGAVFVDITVLALIPLIWMDSLP
jgi:hypothetical protein